MKLWKTQIKRTTLALLTAAVVVPAAQAGVRPDDRAAGPRTQVTQPQGRPDDRAGVRAVDGVTLGDAEGNVSGSSTSYDGYKSSFPQQRRLGAGAGIALDPAYVRALRLRGEAMNKLYGAQVTLDPAYLRSLKIRGEAMNKLYGGTAVRPDDRAGIRGPESTPGVVVSQASRFDWADAGIGALSALGASLLLAGAMLFALQFRNRKQHRVAAL